MGEECARHDRQICKWVMMGGKERQWTKRVIAHLENMTENVLGDELYTQHDTFSVHQMYLDEAPPKKVAEKILKDSGFGEFVF